MIPDSFIQQVLDRTDIVDLIDQLVPLKRAGANYVACCPFHSEKSPSFTVSPGKQFYHCFGCGAHGTAIGFVMAFSGIDFVAAVKDLASRAGLPFPNELPSIPAGSDHGRGLTELMARAARYYYEQLKASPVAIAYLKRRRISGETARLFGLGFAPDGWQNLAAAFPDYASSDLQLAGLVIRNEQGRLYDRFRQRVMFPIVNQRGEVIAFGGRVLDHSEPKYLNSPETPLFEKGREVFGLPQARAAIRAADAVVVVEGYMDVVALAEHGVANAVATLGTATTPMHVRRLLRQTQRLLFCFDGDSAGRKAAWRALENSVDLLSDQRSIGFVFLPEGDDPDSFVREHGKPAFERLLGEATPLSDFLIRELLGRCDLTAAEGRARLVAEAKPLLCRLQSPLLRLQLIKRLSELSGYSSMEVERLCDLPSLVRRTAARLPRQLPSVLRPLLRLLLQKPALADGLALNLLPETGSEVQALRELCQVIAEAGSAVAYPALLERFRGHESEAVLQAAAAELMEQPFAEEQIDAEFAGVVRRLSESHQRRSFEALQEKVRKRGVSGLSTAEKEQYRQILLAQGHRQPD